jgi:flagellar hook-length control protein FliK
VLDSVLSALDPVSPAEGTPDLPPALEKPEPTKPAGASPPFLAETQHREQTGPTPAPHPVARPEPAPVAEQVSQAIELRARFMTQGGTTEFYIKLDPPSLGTVHVHLTATREGLSARLIVGDEATRQALEGQLGGLRQRLEEVTVQQPNQPSLANDHDGQRSHHRDQRNRGRGRSPNSGESVAFVLPGLSDGIDAIA